MKYPVHILYQWDSKNNNALLLTSIKGVLILVEYNLNNLEVKELSDKRIVWALRSEDGQLIYEDHLGQFWQPGAAEHQHIKALENQRGKTKIFLIENNVMFGINSKNKLWSYELNNSEFKILGELGTKVDYLSDISQEQLLMTIQASEKKKWLNLLSANNT